MSRHLSGRPEAVDHPQSGVGGALEYLGAPIAVTILLAIALAGVCNLFEGWW
jgi:hypothetical protein